MAKAKVSRSKTKSTSPTRADVEAAQERHATAAATAPNPARSVRRIRPARPMETMADFGDDEEDVREVLTPEDVRRKVENPELARQRKRLREKRFGSGAEDKQQLWVVSVPYGVEVIVPADDKREAWAKYQEVCGILSTDHKPNVRELESGDVFRVDENGVVKPHGETVVLGSGEKMSLDDYEDQQEEQQRSRRNSKEEEEDE